MKPRATIVRVATGVTANQRTFAIRNGQVPLLPNQRDFGGEQVERDRHQLGAAALDIVPVPLTAGCTERRKKIRR